VAILFGGIRGEYGQRAKGLDIPDGERRPYLGAMNDAKAEGAFLTMVSLIAIPPAGCPIAVQSMRAG